MKRVVSLAIDWEESAFMRFLDSPSAQVTLLGVGGEKLDIRTVSASECTELMLRTALQGI